MKRRERTKAEARVEGTYWNDDEYLERGTKERKVSLIEWQRKRMLHGARDEEVRLKERGRTDGGGKAGRQEIRLGKI